MQRLAHAFLKEYLPQGVVLPEAYKESSFRAGTFDAPGVSHRPISYNEALYTFPDKKAAEAFVAAVKPLFPNSQIPAIEADNSVVVSDALFMSGLKKAFGSVLYPYLKDLRLGAFYFEEHRGSFYFVNVSKERSEQIIKGLAEIGVNVAAYGKSDVQIIYMRRLSEQNFDIKKLAKKVHEVLTGPDYYAEITGQVMGRREAVINALKKLANDFDQAHTRFKNRPSRFYFTDDDRGFRILSTDKELMQAFNDKVLIGQYDFIYNPKEEGTADQRKVWERGGRGSGYNEFLVDIDLNLFLEKYLQHEGKLEFKASGSVTDQKASGLQNVPAGVVRKINLAGTMPAVDQVGADRKDAKQEGVSSISAELLKQIVEKAYSMLKDNDHDNRSNAISYYINTLKQNRFSDFINIDQKDIDEAVRLYRAKDSKGLSQHLFDKESSSLAPFMFTQTDLIRTDEEFKTALKGHNVVDLPVFKLGGQ